MVDFLAIISEFINSLQIVDNAVKNDVVSVHAKLTEAMDLVFAADMQSLYAIFQAPAILMLVLYVLLDMLEKTTSENFSLDSIVLDFTKLIFGMALINNGVAIIQGLYGISELACEKIITESGELIYKSTEALPTETESIWGVIGFFIKTIVNSFSSIGSPVNTVGYLELVLIGLIETVCISVIAYQRAVRIAMRLVLSPFVFADVVGNGLNTNAMHYLKVIFSLCMEGPIICIAVTLVPAAITYGGITVMFYGLATAIVIVKLLFDSHKMAQEMFL